MSPRYRRRTSRREAGGAVGAACAAALACAVLGGCSIGLSDGPESTGSVARPAAVSPLSPDLGQEDWRRARGALAIALDPQGSGAAVKWDNPDTEISGTITPVAQPYVKANEICRAFLATITVPGHTSSVQGTACRVAGDEWRLDDVRPWRKPV